jgi:hypothetical protein
MKCLSKLVFSLLVLLLPLQAQAAKTIALSSDATYMVDPTASTYNNVLNGAVAACVAVAPSQCTVWVTKAVTISSPLTVPATVTLNFFGAGKINCASIGTLRLSDNGPIVGSANNVFDNCPAAALSFAANTVQKIFLSAWFDSPAIAAAVTPAGAVLDTAFVKTNTTSTYAAGAKQSFTASATTAGIALPPVTGQPSTPVAGDLINNAGVMQLRVGSAWKSVAYTDEATAFVKPTIGVGGAVGNPILLYDRQVSGVGVANATGTGNTALFTVPTLPANTLNTDGDQLVIAGSFSTAANSNNKRLGVTFQALTFTLAPTESNNLQGDYLIRITRVDDTHVHIYLRLNTTGADWTAINSNQLVSSLTTSTSALLVVGASYTTGTAGDIRAYNALTTITQ